MEDDFPMNLHDLLLAAANQPETKRMALMTALLESNLFARIPAPASWSLTRPGAGQRAVPAFLTYKATEEFWHKVPTGKPLEIAELPFALLAAEALPVGGIVLDPMGADVTIERGELRLLLNHEVPGAFTAWMRGLDRLGRTGLEVMARLRSSHLYTLAGKDADGRQRLYLLSKSEDGTQAVACFTSPETLAQFAAVRRLGESDQGYGVAIYRGEELVQIAQQMGAFLLLDPESPWETQLEPPLLSGGFLRPSYGSEPN
jgi:hypothetical protein